MNVKKGGLLAAGFLASCCFFEREAACDLAVHYLLSVAGVSGLQCYISGLAKKMKEEAERLFFNWIRLM